MVGGVKRGKCQNLVTRRGWIMQEKVKAGRLPEFWFGDIGGWGYYLLTKEAQEGRFEDVDNGFNFGHADF